jgi:hypothetical protein
MKVVTSRRKQNQPTNKQTKTNPALTRTEKHQRRELHVAAGRLEQEARLAGVGADQRDEPVGRVIVDGRGRWRACCCCRCVCCCICRPRCRVGHFCVPHAVLCV